MSRLNKTISLSLIMITFWAVFWIGNGLDKYFDGDMRARSIPSSTLIDSAGAQTGTIHPMTPTGVFGTTRDGKITEYFDRLSLPDSLSTITLHATGIIETLIGITFLLTAIWLLTPKRIKQRWTKGTKLETTLPNISYKASIIIFALFATADIAWGDRVELWEHSTFIILLILSEQLWQQHQRNKV